MRSRLIVCGLLALLTIPTFADTIPLVFTSLGRENTSGLNITYTYNSTTHIGHLTVANPVVTSPVPVAVSQDGGAHYTGYFNGYFDLEADINTVTGTAIGGSLKLYLGTTAQTIWNAGAPTAFGASSNLLEMDFKFTQSGSSILNGVSNGSTIGIAIYALGGLSSNASLTSNFSGTGAKNDAAEATAPLPNVANAGLCLFGICGAVFARRRRTQLI